MSTKKIGVAGGDGGTIFNDYQAPAGTSLREIRLLADRYINAIQLIYTDKKAKVGELRPVGGLNGELKIFTLDAGERLVGISGRHGWFVDSVVLHTNKRVSEMYGGHGGFNEYSFQAPAGSEIVGFYGRADWHIDQLGIITRTVTAAKPKAKAATKKAAAKPRKSARKKADLTIIEGIGPKLASVLTEAGIPDLITLAKTEVNTLKKVVEQAGRRFNLADPTTWPQQAGLAAKEAWEALEALQDKLKGGKRS